MTDLPVGQIKAGQPVIASSDSDEANSSSSFPDVQLHIVDAPLGAGPESITTIGSMDSQMCNCTS
jgi:hypothetical protein